MMDAEELVPKVAQAIRKAAGSNLPVRWFHPEAKAAIEVVLASAKPTAEVKKLVEQPNADIRKFHGYVPGDFTNRCVHCANVFSGGRSSWRCKSCAEKAHEVLTGLKWED